MSIQRALTIICSNFTIFPYYNIGYIWVIYLFIVTSISISTMNQHLRRWDGSNMDFPIIIQRNLNRIRRSNHSRDVNAKNKLSIRNQVFLVRGRLSYRPISSRSHTIDYVEQTACKWTHHV